MPREFLQDEHPIYAARKQEWLTNERRFRAGRGILAELVRFDWESLPAAEGPVAKDEPRTALPGEHYSLRQSQATYPNFPAAYASMLTGHLMQKRPEPDQALKFGHLGTVSRPEGGTDPNFAELVYYNADGVGNDGSQWDTWWDGVNQWAIVTGHRWLFVEAPARPGTSKREVLDGRRPYLIHYSPLAVSNWHFEEGKLVWAVIRFGYRRPRIGTGGRLEGNATETGYRLLVRAGHAALGQEFAGGGWFEFDKDGAPLLGPNGEPRRGNWAKTQGEIPGWVHYYQRDSEDMSRSGITELGNAAVAYMNLDSAATFDAWDAASSVSFLLGVDGNAHQVVADQLKTGSRVVSVPASRDGVSPTMVDSAAGAVAGGVLNERLTRIRETARDLANLEASSVPDSSGLSKQMGFAEAKAPRLALLASEVESSQNTAIRFLELRFGFTQPTGAVRWPRQFDLAPLLDRLERYFGLEEQTGYRSATVSARAMVAAAKEAGLLGDDDKADAIEDEYGASIAGRMAADTGRVTEGLEFGATGAPLEPAA